ncbi:hypothetical protein SAMN05421678_1207 [Actinopolymorpha cephalotaxi]|uniref:Uncharacterized protein n=1 Tax=Actinopolymorpha cephalotaxi TaxID=504797 RepID=A0A1I3APG1_9ACTN|nr:hypothetical protein [Actinopolymorpha cephalotaxi]NYH85993.1 hypothetical protein [Actinopolymorpha cephalotaxi]SFH51852.1 hypothetical protein SAMN05421678_1207 [Actinopolymorpha cephalotaxi]
MRVTRGFGAAGVFLLATVLMIVSLVCCVTVVLLPLGIPLAMFAVRLYGKGAKMLLPRPQEVQHGLHKLWRRKTKKVRKDAGSEIKGVKKRFRKTRGHTGDQVEGARKGLRKAGRKAGDQLEGTAKSARKVRKNAGRRVRKLRKSANI